MFDSTRHFGRPSIARHVFAVLVTLLAAPASQAQLFVEEISIVAGSSDAGSGPEWYFFIEVTGVDLTAGTATPAAGGPFVLQDEAQQGLLLEYEDGPFATFAALQVAHPPGDYVIALAEGDTVTLGWNPTEPVGTGDQPTLSIDQPADGTADVSATPDVTFSFDCTNCKDLNLEVSDQATGGMVGSLHFGQVDVVGTAFTNPILFTSMMSGMGPPMALPDGSQKAELLLALASFSDQNFDAPSSLPSFEYIEAAALFAQSVFTVPEPSAGLATSAALAVLALLRASRASWA